MTRRLVLIVDDDEDILEIARLSLELGAGWGVCTASSGEAANSLALLEHPDVVLLDVMMPGIDGPETLSRLRADSDTCTIPVIFLTAKAQPSEQRRLLDLGVQGVITKPFDPMALSDRVAEVLGWADRDDADILDNQ